MSQSIYNVIVFDHPYTAKACENVPHHRSFSAALCKVITEKLELRGEQVDLIDLHADEFDPVMSGEDLALWRKGEPMNDQVKGYQERLMCANRIIFIFPIWWELMPAMTKGFLDKVYAKNVLYTQQKGSFKMSTRLNLNTEIVVVTTMGTPKLLYKLAFSKPVIKAMKLGLCLKTGLKHFKWLSYSHVDEISLEQRKAILSSVNI